jgi:hypothetical protein
LHQANFVLLLFCEFRSQSQESCWETAGADGLQITSLWSMMQLNASNPGGIVVFERIGQESYRLGESPIWGPVDRVLCFVDSLAGTVHRYNPASACVEHWNVDCAYLGSLALRADGND